MRKLIAYFPEGVEIDIEAIMQYAVEVTIIRGVERTDSGHETPPILKPGSKQLGKNPAEIVIEGVRKSGYNFFSTSEASTYLEQAGYKKTYTGHVLKNLLDAGVIVKGKDRGWYTLVEGPQKKEDSTSIAPQEEAKPKKPVRKYRKNSKLPRAKRKIGHAKNFA